MNVLDRYVSMYSRLVNIKGVNRHVLSPFRIITRFLARKRIYKYFKKTPIRISDKQSDVIVSFTSFPARIDQAYLVVNCLLRQTVAPKKILLWLSEDQFEGHRVPENLTDLQGDIFEIRFVSGDIRSHKKYYYVLDEYPQDTILIVDDDLFYPTDMLENMLAAADLHPDTVICRYGSIAKFNDGKILPYKEWWNEISKTCDDPNFFFGSGGGTMLRKELLHNDVLNIESALKLTPLADDVWLNAMVNLAGTPKHKVKAGLLLQTQADQTHRLTNENVGNDANTAQIAAICEYYQQFDMNPFPERVK